MGLTIYNYSSQNQLFENFPDYKNAGTFVVEILR